MNDLTNLDDDKIDVKIDSYKKQSIGIEKEINNLYKEITKMNILYTWDRSTRQETIDYND